LKKQDDQVPFRPILGKGEPSTADRSKFFVEGPNLKGVNHHTGPGGDPDPAPKINLRRGGKGRKGSGGRRLDGQREAIGD